MNNYLTSVIFLIFIGIIFFTYQNGHINKSVFVLSLFLFVLILPLFYYGTKRQVENFRSFASLDQLSNASLDAYYTNASSKDLEVLSCNEKERNRRPPITGVYQDISYFKNDYPKITINKNTGVTIGIESVSLESDNATQENKYILKIRSKKNGTPTSVTAETSGLVNNLYMSILSSIELGRLQEKLEKSDNIPTLMEEYKNKLQDQLTFKFGQDGIPETQISNLIDGTWNADLSEEEQLILPGDHLVFAGNLGFLSGLSQIANDQKPTASNTIIVYKVEFENANSQAYKYTRVISSDSEMLSNQDGSDVVLLKNTRTGFLTIKNKNYPRLPYKDNDALKLEAPYLFKTWSLISGDNKYLSFSSFNSESHVFLTEKDNFSKPIYAKSPEKGNNRSVIRLNDKLPQQWTIGLFTNSQNPNALCFIHTLDGLYYLGVDGDKVSALPFGKQTKQLWKITQVLENGVAKYKIQSAYNAKYLAYSANGGYLYGNRGNVYLMNVEIDSAPLWDITFSLAGENAENNGEPNMPIEGFVGKTIIEHQTNQNIAQIQYGAPTDTPISSGTKGAWQPLFTKYWNGKYIYCFTNKGVQTNDNLDNYLEINLNDNGEGIVSVKPDNMQLQDSNVEISSDDRQRYGGDYKMKAVSSNIIWGNKTDVNGVGLYLEMLPTDINKQNLIQQMLMQPNKIRIKAMIIDGNKKMSLCGVTWNQRDRLDSYCSKVIIENFDQVNPSTKVATGAQNTGGAAGNLPIQVTGEDGHYLGYPKIKQGPAAIGASDYTDPELSACMVGPGKKIAIPGWYQDSGDKRLGQVSGTCVSINPSFSAMGRSDASALSSSVRDAGRGTKGQCSGPNYLSGAIRGVPVTYKDIPGRTQIFNGQTANNIINWKGACLPAMMAGPGVYQAFNRNNMTPITGYGYWKKGKKMVSTYRINQYDTNPMYIDQNGNRRNESDYLYSPQTYAYSVANLRPVKEPWRNFWIWNNDANVVCQEITNTNEAFAQRFMNDGSVKYYKFFEIPQSPYNANIDQCKAQYNDPSRKVECFRISDLDPIYSPQRNFWRNQSNVAICELTEYKVGSWSANGYKQPTDAFAIATKQPYCKVKFVRMTNQNQMEARKNQSTFIMPYYFRIPGKDNNYAYPDLPEYLIEIRDYDNTYNGKYKRSNFYKNGRPVWIKVGGQSALIWHNFIYAWILSPNKDNFGSNIGMIPSSRTSNYIYNFVTRGGLDRLLPTGVPIYTWGKNPYPAGPKVYPADITMENFTSNQPKPCIKHGVNLPGWYEDNRFGQKDQCVTFPRNKYATKCCNTTYREGEKAGQNVTYTTENGEVNACNVTFNKRDYPNEWSIQNWKNWCLR